MQSVILQVGLLAVISSLTSGQLCNLDQTVIDDIQSHQTTVNLIINAFLNGSFKGEARRYLATFTDNYGNRRAGTQSLEDAIDHFMEPQVAYAYDRVYSEDVDFPNWSRGNEMLEMIAPRRSDELQFMSFGYSVGTPSGGIEAEVIVLDSFEELNQSLALVPGKIVVFDYPWTNYGAATSYRYSADEVAAAGGVASIVRSLADFSIASPHTGVVFYDDEVPLIPTGAITIEDAAMLHRMYDRGDNITLRLTMDAQQLSNFTSRNLIMEIDGTVEPSEFVILSGHFDSWDVGQGVLDDAGGCIISWLAGTAFNDLGLSTRRSLRTVFFTAEEEGIYGGDAYYASSLPNLGSLQLMLESDGGLFGVSGIAFDGTFEARCMMQEVLNLMSNLNATTLGNFPSTPDLGMFKGAGVPTGSPIVDSTKYFWYHHSEGDSMAIYDNENLDRIAALWTAVAYVTANMADRLPANITSVQMKENMRKFGD